MMRSRNQADAATRIEEQLSATHLYIPAEAVCGKDVEVVVITEDG